MASEDTWREYEKMVLTELERLDNTSKAILETLNRIDTRLTRIEERQRDFDEIKEDVKGLNQFKSIALVVWTILQIVFAGAVAWIFSKIK